jgi:carboxypeptidase Taq
MDTKVEKSLRRVYSTLTDVEKYEHACRVLNYDEETICPKDGMQEQGGLIAFLENKAFQLEKDPEFRRAAEELYANREELGEFDRVLADSLHRDYVRTKNVTPEKDAEHRKIYRQAFVDWLNAKERADYRIFAPSLAKVRDAQLEEIELSEKKFDDPYDSLLDLYERGITVRDLDEIFGEVKERLLPLLEKIRKSGKVIRTDFLFRKVTDEAQRRMAEWLMDVMCFDRNRGAITTTEHPFTDGMGKNDVRITMHYYPDQFLSSIYSVIHESGHALFEMLQPEENYDHFINMNKTMGMHESVSRFYENRIGRSDAFLTLMYPKAREIFPEVLADVTEQEFREAVNLVRPSLIRTEADEFTYTIHIIIRYEVEKEILRGADIGRLPAMWNRKYQEYLGITPPNDREGILQDVHWASGFGYFPAYALGNMVNAMYVNRMKEDLDIDREIRSGSLEKINSWMKEHVFKKADRQDPKTWIREITGREFTPKDFLDYLEEKYGAMYGLNS